MFFEKFFRFLKGYMVISVTGKFPERFLNVCANKGIFLSDVTYIGENSVRLKISRGAYSEIEQIMEKTGCKVKVLFEGGLPLFARKYKRRMWLFLGAIIFVLALIILNLFVWEIEIIGCEKVLPETVEENLESLGVKTGVLRFTIDQRHVKNEMLIKMPELSWIWVDNKGSKITVSVRESVPKPEIYDYGDYCNIVAAKDGIIDSVIVRSGTLMFDVGDTVLKNDILVSGLMISERGIEPRFLQAEAEIYARVWYEQTKKFPLFEEKTTDTGRKSKKRVIKIFGLEFTPFWYKNPQFKNYTIQKDVKELTVFGRFMGIKITTEQYTEYEKEQIPLKEESVAEAGAKEILTEMENETAAGATLKDYSFSYVKNDDNTVSVTVVSEFIENIAKKVRIE
ncbi:MAG: sporulation protein YqfD [Ruminococcaceae bacterium]|nr:sporulation protein YqfD [Oscillospiraceae bacterium]